MSTNKTSKINQLLQSQPQGAVYLSSWLEKRGYSRDLQRRYVKSGWLEPFGRGALKRTGQNVDWSGMLYSLQKQKHMEIHVGGRSALNLLGLSHYLEISQKRVEVFTPRDVHLPDWLRNNKKNIEFIHYKTNFLPSGKGLTEYEKGGLSVEVSGAVRALMECLFLVPRRFDLLEAYQIMEGLTATHPDEAEDLLSACSSVKVTRLFLYLAEKAEHLWVKKIDFNKVNLGKGKRSISKSGVLISNYNIVIPAEIANA